MTEPAATDRLFAGTQLVARIERAEASLIASGIEVSKSGVDELDLWLDVVVDGFAHPDAQGVASHEEFPREVLERVIRDLALVDGFERYLARRDGEIAGGASLRIAADVVVVATQPGSKSQQNVHAQGFDLLYARAILLRRAPETG